jgi:hypothetical protein
LSSEEAGELLGMSGRDFRAQLACAQATRLLTAGFTRHDLNDRCVGRRQKLNPARPVAALAYAQRTGQSRSSFLCSDGFFILAASWPAHGWPGAAWAG